RRHGVASNVEMQQRALGLRSPINIRRDFDLSHAVGFGAGLRLDSGFSKSSHDEISCASGVGREREKLPSASTDIIIKEPIIIRRGFSHRRDRASASRFILFY